MKGKIGLVLAPLAFLLVTGCATLGDMEKAQLSEGISRHFSADYERVKAAALACVQSLNLDVERANENGAYLILFSKPLSGFSWGEVGRVVVQTVDNGAVVSVLNGKRYKLQVTGTEESEFAKAILDGIVRELAERP